MDEDALHFAALYSTAFTSLRAELLLWTEKVEGPKSIRELVEMSADLKAISERFESLTRGVLDLHRRATV